jgi:hypothetical protein
MTPKEKAFELFNQYLKILGGINSADWVYFHGNEAKQCALIAVDEILKSVEGKYDEYWEEVLKEIEKL